MAGELARVRPRFVEKVSKQVIRQLLDDIAADGIVNDGEREFILEVNNIREDEARRLIDAVKKKGDGASSRMIAHIKRRDPELHSELDLSCGQSAPLAAGHQMKQEYATSLIPTTDAFWRSKQNDKDIYPAAKRSIQNRVALLITNIKFTCEKLNRCGGEHDEKNMKELLTNLGYEVLTYRNLTAKEIDEAMTDFSKHPKLKDTDSVLVVIMSHGKLGTIVGVNSKIGTAGDEEPDEFPIDNIYKHLGSEKCPALLNKPKIIIIQACRGEKGGSVLVNTAVFSDDGKLPCPSTSAGEEDIEDDNLKCVHKEKDFISLLSCTPDTVSYRETAHGSFLIQYVVDVFNTFAHKDDIEVLFRKVMRRFDDFCIQNKRQMPTKDRCSLTKSFYFFPGL